MKKLLLLLGAFLAFQTTQAQYFYTTHTGGNPGTLNADAEYPVGGGLPTGWTTLLGTASAAPGVVWSPVVNLPAGFAFSFNSTPVTSYMVATTGVLTFTTTATAVPPVTKVALPSPLIPDNSIAVWGLTANAGDYIVHKTFGTAPNRQHWVQFNSYSQTSSATAGYTYWSIVLEETTNKIYIVDQRSAGVAVSVSAGVQINSTTAFMVAGSPNLNSTTLTTADPTPVDNTYYAFTPGVQPTRDLSVTAVTNPTYLILPNAPFTITGTIRNLGSAPVTSFTLNYAINGGTPVSSPITANIASGANYTFSHPLTWTPAAAGNYTITAWATNINGGTDEVTSNDVGSKTVIVAANTTPRTVLHEVFTSSTCPPCKPGNANLHTITQANPGKSIDIKYQQNFPAPGNDPYQTAESINRRGYYGVNSIPRMEVDGGWDGNANSYTTGLLNSFQSKPSLVSISGTHTIIGNTINATAVIDPIGNNIPSTDLVIQMVITERYNTGNVRTNGETIFYDVAKKMMPNENGTPTAPLVAGSTRTLTQSYTFPATNIVEDFDSLDVVIFLQDKVTKEVFQSAYSVRTNSPTGIADDAAAAMVKVYPNPSNGMVKLTFDPKAGDAANVVVYNMLGEKMSVKALNNDLGQLSLDLSGQAAGFYLVNLQLGDKIVIKKISLIK